MSQDDRHGANSQTYLEMASRLVQLAVEAKSPQMRAEFVALAELYQNLARKARSSDWAPMPPPPALGQELMPSSWHGSYLPYRREVVLSQAPGAPGVYALWTPSHWVYVGESADLRARLLTHLTGDHECLTQQGACGFGFELIEDAQQRAARVHTLVIELLPVCNALSG